MIRRSMLLLSQGPAGVPLESEEKGLSEVVQWIQEHTNLCMVVACAGNVDSDTQARLREKLISSANKGRQLVQTMAMPKSEWSAVLAKLQENSIPLAPVAGSARTRTVIPLSGSGFRRGEEGLAPKSQQKSPANVGSSALNGVSSCSSLAPSRTYLKKSGN
jgi:hypothetical protein